VKVGGRRFAFIYGGASIYGGKEFVEFVGVVGVNSLFLTRQRAQGNNYAWHDRFASNIPALFTM
jgi:hypothetical protein